MKFYPKQIITKSGEVCLLKSPGPQEAQAVIHHMKITSGETLFLARYPDEIQISVDSERDFLEKQLASPKDLMICAIVGGELVANGSLNPVSTYERCLHRACFGIPIRRAFWNQGIGSAILAALLSCAPGMGYEQVELEVAGGNEQGLALYRKFGFEIYGERKRSFKNRDHSYASEYLMIKYLSMPPAAEG